MSTRSPASAEHASRAAIGQRVKNLRQRRGMTLRNLASGLMVSSATVSAIENGHTGLSAVRLGEVAALLGVSVEELYASPSGSSTGSWRSGKSTPDRGDAAPSGLEVTAVPPVVSPFDWRHYPPLVLDPPLAAALSSFLDLGYHGATMRHIAQRAGLSVPGVYHYYPSKHEMLVAILDLTMDDLIRRSSAARDEGVGPVERFALLVECLALYHTHRNELGFVGASEMRSLAPQPRARLAGIRRAQQRMVDVEVQEGARSGAFLTERPLEAARAVVTMCTALPQWYSPTGPTSAEEVARQYVEFALDLVRYQPVQGVRRAAALSGS